MNNSVCNRNENMELGKVEKTNLRNWYSYFDNLRLFFSKFPNISYNLDTAFFHPKLC